MLKRRLLLGLPLGLLACGGPEEPAFLPPLVTGYRHLTPLRLNVLEVEFPEPAARAVSVMEPAPVRPEAEIRRMGQERLVPVGTTGTARFLITRARFSRERLPPAGGLGGMFAGEPGERLSCDLACRIEVMNPEDGRSAFAEAEARRMQSLADGTSPIGRQRAAETMIRQAMEALNVEFEFQIRRALRAWLVEGNQPLTPASVEREDLSVQIR